MIEFEHVGFGYGRVTTIEDISFHIHKGEFVALIGANGAGKSTLSKLCNGLLKPVSGQVTVAGQDTKKVKTSRLAKTVGFLFQNPDRQICQNTIRGEIRFGLECVQEDPAEITRRCEEMLELFGFDGDGDPFSMSRGERQRIALASVLAVRPQVLILDEPTTGLDYRECMQIMGIISELNQKGVTVIMVTHDMEIVSDFAKRVLLLGGGRLLGDGPTREIMSNETLLRSAAVLPPQIPALALRLGEGFKGVFTVGEMCGRICEIPGEKTESGCR